jgi:maltose-binding protein MalE
MTHTPAGLSHTSGSTNRSSCRFPFTPSALLRTLHAARLTWLRALLITIFPLLILAGCGSSDDRVRIRIWHEKRAAERDLFEDAIAEYNRSHAGIVVETLYRETEELRNLYVVAAVGGRGPDLIYSPADNAGVFDLTDVVMPLDSLFTPAFFDGFMDAGLVRYENRTMMISDQVRTFLAFVHNRKLLPEAPQTIDQWIAALQAATIDIDGDGTPDQYGMTWNYREPFFFIPFLSCFGGWVMDEAGNPTLDTPETVRAIKFVIDLRDKYHVIPGESDYEMAEALFQEGRAASIINGPWAFAGYGNAGVDYGIAPLPQHHETGNWCAPMVATSGYAVNSNVPADKLPHIRELIEFLTSAEMQERMIHEIESIPVREELRDLPAVKNSERLQSMIRQIEVGRPMPVEPQMRQIWDGMRGPYQLVMNGAVSPEEGARMMQQEVKKRIADTFL